MDVETYLRAHGASLTLVSTCLQSQLHLQADEVVVAVGSLAEGMGTRKSDMDLVLITPGCRGSSGSLSLLVGSCLLDIRILHATEWESLLDRFNAWCRSTWDVTHAVKFTLDERTLLHRILHGQVLTHGNRTRQLKTLPERRDLARLKLHVAHQMARTIQTDLVGYREIGDFRSIIYGAEEVLGQACDALLAGYELTNPLTKWRSRLLDFVPDSWERLLVIRPTGLNAGARVWDLHARPKAPTPFASLRYSERIITFSRAVFYWAEQELLGASSQCQSLWRWQVADAGDRRLPCLDLDTDFSISSRSVSIGRLNEFSDAVELCFEKASIMLLCDGVNTERQAALAIYNSNSRASIEKVRHVVNSLRRANLIRPTESRSETRTSRQASLTVSTTRETRTC